MSMNCCEFIQLMVVVVVVGLLLVFSCVFIVSVSGEVLYDVLVFGNVSLLYMIDSYV